MSADVVKEVLARLQSISGLFVYDGEVEKDKAGQPVKTRYAVLYAPPGRRVDEALAGTNDSYLHRWQVTSVGSSAEQVRWVATKCRDALLDTRITADGWQVSRVRHTADEPVLPDDDLPGKRLFYAVDQYELTATR